MKDQLEVGTHYRLGHVSYPILNITFKRLLSPTSYTHTFNSLPHGQPALKQQRQRYGLTKFRHSDTFNLGFICTPVMLMAT